MSNDNILVEKGGILLFHEEGTCIFRDIIKARENMDTFAERFGVQKPERRFDTRLLVPGGTVLYAELILPVHVSVNFYDVSHGGITVWVRIGEDYPSIPFLEQYDDPITMTYDEAIEFVLKVKDTVKRTPWLFVKSEDEEDDTSEDEEDDTSEDESDYKSEYKSDNESDAKSDYKSDAKPDAKPIEIDHDEYTARFVEWIWINFACSLASDAKPGVKYPETNAGYKAWVKAKKEAEEAAEREAEIRGKSTTVYVLHWKDSTIYDLPYDGKKFFLTQEEALNWAKNNFERWDAWDESLLNTGKWKIVSTDSGNIVDFDPFLWNYDGFNSQEDFWSNPIVYNYNDDDFYTPKRWDEDDEEKEIAKAIAKILRSKAFNLGLGLKLSMKKCGMFDDSDVM